MLTWNTAGRVGKQRAQAEAIGKLRPDVAALQEVTLLRQLEIDLDTLAEVEGQIPDALDDID